MTLIREPCFLWWAIVKLLKIPKFPHPTWLQFFNISSPCGLFNSYCFLLLSIEKGWGEINNSWVRWNKFVGVVASWVCMDSDTGVVFHVLCEKVKLLKIRKVPYKFTMIIHTQIHFNSLIFLHCVVTCQYYKSLSNMRALWSDADQSPFGVLKLLI
jgi:hypothetical protein